MRKNDMDRRGFLRASLAAGAGIGALVAGSRATSAAGTLQRIAPASPLGLDLQNRCGGAAEHAQLLAELQAKLAEQNAAAGATLSLSAPCPICGCSLTAYRTVK
jgi:hypothetical protein